MLHRTLGRLGAVLGVSAAVLVATALPALAHVTISPTTAPQDSYPTLTFTVPNEKDANTTKVEVAFPADQPLATVNVQQVAGWTAAVTKTTLAKPIKNDDGDDVSQVINRVSWTANSPATALHGEEFQQFAISVGPLPKAGTMEFKALQTYSDGSVVRWIEEQTGSAEPDHPAPILTLVKAADASATPRPDVATTSGSPTGTNPNGLAIAGLIAGLAGLVAGGFALARGGKAPKGK